MIFVAWLPTQPKLRAATHQPKKMAEWKHHQRASHAATCALPLLSWLAPAAAPPLVVTTGHRGPGCPCPGPSHQRAQGGAKYD